MTFFFILAFIKGENERCSRGKCNSVASKSTVHFPAASAQVPKIGRKLEGTQSHKKTNSVSSVGRNSKGNQLEKK